MQVSFITEPTVGIELQSIIGEEKIVKKIARYCNYLA